MRIIGMLPLIFLLSCSISEAGSWSAQLSYAPSTGHGEPKDVHGERAALRYMAKSWDLKDIQGFLESSVTHYHTSWNTAGDDIFLIGLAPVLRFSFINKTLTPYLEISIGGAWMSQETFGHRRLGRQVLFQDMAGAGVRFGATQNFYAAFHIIHYSNAGFFKSNMGITVPLSVTLGGHFG